MYILYWNKLDFGIPSIMCNNWPTKCV